MLTEYEGEGKRMRTILSQKTVGEQVKIVRGKGGRGKEFIEKI